MSLAGSTTLMVDCISAYLATKLLEDFIERHRRSRHAIAHDWRDGVVLVVDDPLDNLAAWRSLIAFGTARSAFTGFAATSLRSDLPVVTGAYAGVILDRDKPRIIEHHHVE